MAFMPESVQKAIAGMNGKQAEAVTSLISRQERRLSQYKEQEAATESVPGQLMQDVPIALGAAIRGFGERAAHRWGFDQEYRQAVPFLLGGAYTGAAAMGWSIPRQMALGACLPDVFEMSRGEAARTSYARQVLKDELDDLAKLAA